MKPRTTVIAIFALAASVLAAPPAHAASFSAQGTVYDHNGLVVAGARVAIFDSTTYASLLATTDVSGNYSFVGVAKDSYVVEVTPAVGNSMGQTDPFVLKANMRVDYIEGVPFPATPTIFGTEGDDVITGTDGRDVIFGLGGNDTIHGLGAGDVILGGTGNDTIYGDDGPDVLLGGAGDDLVYGGAGADILTGWEGADTLRGEGGNDTIFDFDYDYVAFNRLIGGAGDDSIMMGNPTSGFAAHTLIVGGSGNDTITAPANTTIRAGAGDDIIYVAPRPGAATVDCGDGNDIAHPNIQVRSDDVYTNCESVVVFA